MTILSRTSIRSSSLVRERSIASRCSRCSASQVLVRRSANEIEEETILREQQKRCLAAAASYGWAVRREVFEPLQLSARGMDDRTGIQTILDDVCNRRFDLLMIASMDRLSYDKEEVKAFLAEMDLNGISIFNVGSNTVTLASGWDLMAFIRQMISPENGGDAQ